MRLSYFVKERSILSASDGYDNPCLAWSTQEGTTRRVAESEPSGMNEVNDIPTTELGAYHATRRGGVLF